MVRGRADRFAATYARRFPAAVGCLMADWASLTTYLRFPAGHHGRIRHSNFIERTFGETRRRVKVSQGDRSPSGRAHLPRTGVGPVGDVSADRDTTTTKGTVYYYKVTGVSSAGEGLAWNEASTKAR